MSDYSQVNDYSAKDALVTGNPEKLILGSDIDDELSGISIAIATKYDSSDLASQANAEAETSNAVLMTPLRVANWADYNAGIVGDLQALADPNADRILFWDDSAGAAAGLAPSTGLAISGTNLVISSTAGILEDLAVLADPGADRILGWDESADAAIGFALSTGLTTSGTSLLVDSTVVALLGGTAAFTSDQTITKATPRLILQDGGSTNPAIRFNNSGGTALGFVGFDNGADINTGDAAGTLALRAEGGGLTFSGNAGATVHFQLSSAGALTTPNASSSEVGFKGVPINTQTDNYTAVLADANKLIYETGASKTITIPAEASVNYPVGTTLTFLVVNATGASIAITTDNLYLAGTALATTGTRTLAHGGIATAVKFSSQNWIISGSGLT